MRIMLIPFFHRLSKNKLSLQQFFCNITFHRSSVKSILINVVCASTRSSIVINIIFFFIKFLRQHQHYLIFIKASQSQSILYYMLQIFDIFPFTRKCTRNHNLFCK